MPVTSCDKPISKNLASNSPARATSDATPTLDYPLVNVAVTFAPLAVWRDSHWTCTVMPSASTPVRME
jgi:hypothetical protein